jgi:hypothetical protein
MKEYNVTIRDKHDNDKTLTIVYMCVHNYARKELWHQVQAYVDDYFHGYIVTNIEGVRYNAKR